MEERGIVEDALKQLDELFLLVVVGEFNSGKSTIINALLGQKFLAEGILPTTNEISILKFAQGAAGSHAIDQFDQRPVAALLLETDTDGGAADGEQKMVQEADGSFVQYIPAPLLEQVNIVDTPGTNVIVERQQRLTEEFVPRADLVLFCLSAGVQSRHGTAVAAGFQISAAIASCCSHHCMTGSDDQLSERQLSMACTCAFRVAACSCWHHPADSDRLTTALLEAAEGLWPWSVCCLQIAPSPKARSSFCATSESGARRSCLW